jgi:1-acyl-sn-glycerol-3-phosphate acyltransferase
VIIKAYPNASRRLNNRIDSYDFLRKTSNELLEKINFEVEVIDNSNHDFNSGSFIIANHQDNLDIVSMIAKLDFRVKFVAKKELFTMPFLNKYIKLSNSFSLDRDNPRSGVRVFKEALNQVENSHNVVIYPEGTRNKSKLLLPFNSGLFNIIRKSSKPIIPTYINYHKNKISIYLGEKIYCEEKIKGKELCDVVFDNIAFIKSKYNNHKKINILGTGDSLTLGLDNNDQVSGGYYKRIENVLRKENLLDGSNNLAIKGLTSSLLLETLSSNNNLIDNVIKADLIYISIATNDIIDIIKDGKDNTKIKDKYDLTLINIDRIINRIRTLNKKASLALIGPYFPYLHLSRLAYFDMSDYLNKELLKLENKYKGLHFICINDEFRANKDEYLPNKRNVHPSADGYQYIFERVILRTRKVL